MKKILLMLVCLLLVVLPVYGITGSMGNAIMVLRPDVQPGETKIIEKSIFVRNVNNVSINITLEPDDGLRDIVEILDKEFVLQPGESKNAGFVIRLDDQYTHAGRIVVSFAPPKGSGVMLSSKITIIGTGPDPDEKQEVDEVDENEPVEENTEENIPEKVPEESEIGDGENTVSVSVGGTGSAVAEDEDSKNPNPVVGISILLVIILIGTSIFLIVRGKSK